MKATIYYKDIKAGILKETEEGYEFTYDKEYIKNNPPISITLPLQEQPFVSKTFFPFFDNLIPEGWLLTIAINNWKIQSNNKMELLKVCCADCIGAVSVK